MTHFNETNPFPDPIITLMDDNTWKLDWRSESDTTPVARVVLESLFKAHNDYVQAHERQFVRRDGSVTTERPVTAAGRLLAQLEVLERRMDNIDTQNAILLSRLDAVESSPRRVIVCQSCHNTFGAPASGAITCPYCRAGVG